MKVFKIPSVFMAIDKISGPVKKMFGAISAALKRTEEDVARFERRWRSIGETSKKVARKSAIVGLALAAPLIVAARDAINFEDRMADVAKTTGLVGAELDKFGKDLLIMSPDTRTPIEELQKIAAIGGQMGVAKNELLAFTDATNKFNVALGSDFGGGVEEAAKAISGLKVLFKETRNMEVGDAITRAGSAINALSAKGVNVPEVTEFVARIGQLPDAIKPSIQATTALGAVMNKAGITAEIASRGMGDILLTGAQNLPKFAKVMGMTTVAANELINTKPEMFLARFAESLKGMDAVKLAKTLKSLKVMDTGAVKVVGALGSSMEMLAGPGGFLTIANDEFARGTSLLNEYNVKNNTTKAGLEKVMNNFKAISITIGTELLPVIGDLMKDFAPVLKSFLEWTRNNPGTIKTVLKLVMAISALSFIVSGVATIMAGYAQVMLLVSQWTNVVTAAQWLWNAAMTANPIGLVIVAIAALIALIVVAVKYYDKWGAAVLFLIGPLGWIVSLVKMFARNWKMIQDANGFIGTLKAIGKILADVLLYPMQQVAEIIASLTGADWAASAAADIEAFRKEMGVNVDRPVNTKATEAEVSRSIEEKKQTVGITINDRTGSAQVDNGNQLLIPVKLSTTLGGGLYGR
jgi:TP901 family phage tail tape measure protein